jgi:hypothetical protein
MNAPVCPWCIGFRAIDPVHAGVSHGICARCAELMLEQAAMAAANRLEAATKG